MLFWDDVKSSFDPQQQNEAVVPTSANHKWKNNTNSYGKPFHFTESEDTKSHRKSVFYEATAKSTFLMEPNYQPQDSQRKRLFVSWWYKPSMDPSTDGGSNKFIRIWDNSSGYGTRISWTQMHLTCGEKVHWGRWNGQVNEWNHHMIDVDLEKKSTRTWINGQLIHDLACEKDPGYPNLPLHVRLLGFEHNLNLFQNMTTALTDIYIASSPARVEISEDSRWTPAMKKEILPIKSWTDNKIVVGFHDGLVKTSGKTYLYVINHDEKVNAQGVLLSCPSCPKSPLTP
ncbi:hypothetical protein C4F51_02390 [Cellvibrio sp. KB43]|uniref:Uncharacterized protein n=2 Tax=Cellvibrio polysaccharolyticus TaxID=2082724 RepID=A0A928UZP0_9GAMM|nr:hypothetical protein [Cellvibrio polysaccharolyticus]